MEDHARIKRDFFKNKKVKAEYDRLKPEFDAIAEIIQKRMERGLTQAELARKIGTKQSAIARLESGAYNPSFLMLRKVAQALDAELRISFV